ncbi:aryl-sulfate sulfotransferase [Parabacteroides sp. Marseille-P3160]|uniref:aryl-sulfate sulfotransferase n=1 Tax=Parabacteroides sp. Marseille-P3160 TaxID=1917887 RepID=UPI0009BBD587|nr:aryl-sulfate sulfotransferase [Parabacteroides sp. Marseille-P3160]
MNKRNKNIVLSITILLLIIGLISGAYKLKQPTIKDITFSDQHSAMHYAVDIVLNKPAKVNVEYTEVKTGETFRTPITSKDTIHHIDLLLLKADSEYTYKVIVHDFFHFSTKKYTFKTRKQSPWLVNHWLTEERPHEATALGDGMVMVTYGRVPGYILIMDAEGEVRWYWQVEDIGVRSACITPRGTILAMLRPPIQDIRDDLPQSEEEVHADEEKKPMRRGSIGFAGGTAIAEISLSGKLLWRFDLDKIHSEKDFQSIHHDVLMNEKHQILALYRPKKIIEKRMFNKLETDTLGGDGILVLDTLGNILDKWSIWDHWDTDNDPYIERYKYDRFHINGLCLDEKGNYYLSAPIEDQVWKINRQTGDIEWKFGRNGDFAMDTTTYFSFQHSPHFNSKGELMLFDNGLYDKRSGAKSFLLDEKNKTADIRLNAPLPSELYTSRMGSAYLLPNGNILQTSSKRGAVVITGQDGKILWQINLSFAPYRATYVPSETWKAYFEKVK